MMTEELKNMTKITRIFSLPVYLIFYLCKIINKNYQEQSVWKNARKLWLTFLLKPVIFVMGIKGNKLQKVHIEPNFVLAFWLSEYPYWTDKLGKNQAIGYQIKSPNYQTIKFLPFKKTIGCSALSKKWMWASTDFFSVLQSLIYQFYHKNVYSINASANLRKDLRKFPWALLLSFTNTYLITSAYFRQCLW